MANSTGIDFQSKSDVDVNLKIPEDYCNPSLYLPTILLAGAASLTAGFAVALNQRNKSHRSQRSLKIPPTSNIIPPSVASSTTTIPPYTASISLAAHDEPAIPPLSRGQCYRMAFKALGIASVITFASAAGATFIFSYWTGVNSIKEFSEYMDKLCEPLRKQRYLDHKEITESDGLKSLQHLVFGLAVDEEKDQNMEK